jgi:hypothetical protein
MMMMPVRKPCLRQSGGEIGDVDDLRDGDELYVTQGEDYAP